MKFYLAPMEGITGHIYRNSYEKYFHNIKNNKKSCQKLFPGVA